VKTNIVSTIAFVGFVMLGLLVTAGGRSRAEPAKRRLTNAFLIFALMVSFAAGLTQHNMWPFSSWPVLAMPMPAATRELPTPRIVGVDANGNEYDIDYRAWQPLALEELNSWLNLHFFRLDPAAQDRVGRYFLDRANRAREEAISPSGLAYPNRWLGPLTAPTHMIHPAIWSDAARVPRNSFVRVRIYQQSWDLEARLLDPAKVTRVLAYEYPRS
jgi:hypothetical protein